MQDPWANRGVDLGSRRNDVHRATYTLELGVWYATCNICGYRISDPVRRRTAAAYRSHIRDAGVIDLTVAVSALLTPTKAPEPYRTSRD